MGGGAGAGVGAGAALVLTDAVGEGDLEWEDLRMMISCLDASLPRPSRSSRRMIISSSEALLCERPLERSCDSGRDRAILSSYLLFGGGGARERSSSSSRRMMISCRSTSFLLGGGR